AFKGRRGSKCIESWALAGPVPATPTRWKRKGPKIVPCRRQAGKPVKIERFRRAPGCWRPAFVPSRFAAMIPSRIAGIPLRTVILGAVVLVAFFVGTLWALD